MIESGANANRVAGRVPNPPHRRSHAPDAILDRLVHRSHRIHLQAKESLRKREATKEAAKASTEA